jgi:hypothetical protein
MSESWGYRREQSRASKARRLKSLTITEVSSVRAGAGVGCRVLIRKRIDDDNERTKQMSDVDIAKANQNYALAEQQHALKMFPESKTVGEALARFHQTDIGKRVLNAVCKNTYERSQFENALGDGFGKSVRDTPQERHDNDGRQRAMTGDALNDDDCTKTIADYMKTGMNFDQAASTYLRGRRQ